jgi:CRP-like cAMP-binding protein
MFNVFAENSFRFTPEESDALTKGGRDLSFAKGEIMRSLGDPNETVYFLRKGTIKYHMIYPDGTSQTTAFSKAPAILGVMNLNPHQTSINYCSAITRCEARCVPISLFMERVRELGLMEKLLHLTIGAARHAYRNLLVTLSGNRVELADILRNSYGLTLQETAEFIGCSRVHVSRLLKQGRRQD